MTSDKKYLFYFEDEACEEAAVSTGMNVMKAFDSLLIKKGNFAKIPVSKVFDVTNIEKNFNPLIIDQEFIDKMNLKFIPVEEEVEEIEEEIEEGIKYILQADDHEVDVFYFDSEEEFEEFESEWTGEKFIFIEEIDYDMTKIYYKDITLEEHYTDDFDQTEKSIAKRIKWKFKKVV